MKTAQDRDAARKKKFYFRKDVFQLLSPLNTPLEEDSDSQKQTDTTNSDSPTTQAFKKAFAMNRARLFKERALRNCFPAPPSPLDSSLSPVDEEYELMSMYEIMNGKVRRISQLLSQ